MDAQISVKIVEEFDEKISIYGDFGEKLSILVKELLREGGVSVHSVTFRSKDKRSFVKKINKSSSSYERLTDITDLCGLRVITHFNDDVARASEIIEAEFQVDLANSVNKAEILDPDRFGYLSAHYVVSNKSTRNNLGEYRRFKDIKAEIQIRSILQHAWAEIEHDLGYKSKTEVPREIRRRFSRLAGLLELADQEFSTIRDELTAYSGEVVDLIKNSPSLVEINIPSLQVLTAKSGDIQALDQAISEAMGRSLVDSTGDSCADLLKKLSYLKVVTVGDLEESIRQRYDMIINFSKAWLNRTKDDGDGGRATRNTPVARGISVFYLCYLIALEKSKFNPPYEYTKFFSIGRESNETAELLKRIFNEVKGVVG